MECKTPSEKSWKKSGKWKYDLPGFDDEWDRAMRKLEAHVTHIQLSPDYQIEVQGARDERRERFQPPNTPTTAHDQAVSTHEHSVSHHLPDHSLASKYSPALAISVVGKKKKV